MNIEEIKEKLDSRVLFESDFNTIDDILDSTIEFIESQQKTIKELVDHCRDLSVNHDCDNDAHKYNSRCYVCESDKLYNKYKDLLK